MNRRRALVAIGASLVVLHCATPSAQQSKPRRIGYLSAASAETNAPRLTAFRKGMSELGWVDGKDFVIEAKYANTVRTSIRALAGEIIASRPDIVLTPSDDAIAALADATKTIPIVFATASDPVKLGLVKSLQHPGGNLTGLVMLRSELGAKRLQLLKQTFPHVAHVAVLFETENISSSPQVKEIEAAAQRLDVRVSSLGIKTAGEIEMMIKQGLALGCQAYVVVDGFLVNNERRRIAKAILASRRPAIFGRPEQVEAGGLMSYGASPFDNYRRSATYDDKILKGVNPGELPIEQPSKFELTINLKTAKATGITVPTSLLVRADRVIE